jgi:hypothetical protein
MYKGLNRGSVIDSRGECIQFSPGSLIDAPQGSLDHCRQLEWIEPVKKPAPIEQKVDMNSVLDKALEKQIESVKPKGKKRK